MSAGEPMTKSGLAKRLFMYLDMKVNPVLLRDLRLYGRGKGMTWVYFFTLAILVMAGIAYTLLARWNGLDGRQLLYIPTVLLSLIVGAAIPNLVGERFRGELASRATELALVSPLSPARLVRGKLFGAWCLTLQALSLAAPIFATAYLLGGVTAWDILALVGGVLLAGLVMPMPQMYLATDARMQRTGGRILFGLALVGNAIVMYAYASFLYETFVGDPYQLEVYLAILAGLAIAGLLYAQFLYFVTVGRLRGVAENRELAPRLSLVFGTVAGGAAAFAMAKILSSYGSLGGRREMLEFMVAAFMVLAGAFCVGVLLMCEGNTDAPRLPLGAPRRGILSRLFFSTGAASLTAFFLVVSVCIIGVGLFCLAASDTSSLSEAWSMSCVLLTPFMALAYGLSAYFFLVRPLKKETPSPKLLLNTVIVTNVILILVSVFVQILGAEMRRGSGFQPFLYGSNPLGLFLGAFERSSRVPDIAQSGLLVLALLFLALLPMALRALGRGSRNAA